VEVGAGYGAACEGVLYYMRNFQPELFANLEYHLVDISPEACKLAEKRLSEDFSSAFKKGNLRIFNMDFLKYKQNTQKNEMWFILFLEVFDNLAHDKVIDGKQVYVENMKEYTEEISDPLIKETYNLY
jgi:SAM-dependent MidA family methyltransferase